MDLYNLKVSELTSLIEVKKYLRYVKLEVEVLEEDLLFCYEMPTPEMRAKRQFLNNLLTSLRIRSYELQEPIYSDGTIDLYQDNDNCFTICESNQKIPVGVIKYIDTRNIVPGNISYQIYEPYQGHHYALHALRIIGEQLLENGVKKIYITATNNQNIPSMKTIEEFGGVSYWGDIDKLKGPVPYTCNLEEIYSK